MVFSVNPSLCTDVPPPSEKSGKREHDYRRRFTDVSSPDFLLGRGGRLYTGYVNPGSAE